MNTTTLAFRAFLVIALSALCVLLPESAEAQSRSRRAADAEMGLRNLGVRYLKLANTYREARNYDLAQAYAKKGLDMVRNQGSRYWEATGYEYLGLIYRDLGERDLALEYLRVAQTIFAGILNPNNPEGSHQALKMVIADLEQGVPSRAEKLVPPVPVERGMPENDRLRSDNQRLQDVNMQLTNRIRDLEDRIRRLEQMPAPQTTPPQTTYSTPFIPNDISECKRDIEAIARYRESVLWSNTYTPVNFGQRTLRISDPNTRANGTIITGFLKRGESVKIEMDVTPGMYAIIADGCLGKARDIDVRIINARGVVLDKKDIRFTEGGESANDRRISDANSAERAADRDARVSEERNPQSTTATTRSTSNDTTPQTAVDARKPSSNREPLAKLSWNAEYGGMHTFLVTMYDCEPEGAYFCFVIGKK